MRDLVFDGNPGASTNSGTRTRTPQDNWLARIVLRKEATELKIEGEFTMQITVLNPLACSSRLTPAPLRFTPPSSRPSSPISSTQSKGYRSLLA